jgi:hypothetical protein
MSGAPRGPTCLSTKYRVLVDRDALVVDATVQIRVVLEDHGAAPMREEVRRGR